MASIEQLVTEATRQYILVDEVLLELEGELKTPKAERLNTLTNKLHLYMEKAKELDQDIEHIAPVGLSESVTAPLMQDKRSLMKRVHEKINTLAPRLIGMRALYKNELNKIAQGKKTALQYGARGVKKTGSIINAAK